MHKKHIPTLAKISLAASLFLTAGIAQAASLGVANATPISFFGYNGQPATFTGGYSTGFLGILVANQPSRISFTYLGSESGFNNSFSFLGNMLTESNAPGDTTASVLVDAGAVNFSFSDDRGGTVANGEADKPALGFAILNGNLTPVNGPDFGPFDYVLGFNDSSNGDADYDDFVVGVRISEVPLPASLPLMAAALGLFTVARRRI
ncbi:MAG: hypothetical protein BVN34_01770 [Proteobacteria bacterium ST_bin12]|nr:MAG: hypothetical protein BVN34_01770 [Proteobacteria bacterium ST_bin12]